MGAQQLSDEELDRMLLSSGPSDAELDAMLMGGGNAAPAVPNIILQETHPAISWGERAAVKNFGGTPRDTIAYLKKNHDTMEFQDDGEQITMRLPGEKEFRVLDPKGFDAADITDIGVDIGTGLASGALTAAGGLAGGLPGAMGMGAVSSGGLEYARQKLGQALGVRSHTDIDDVLISGGLGAATPFLFGSGASTGQIAKNLAGEKGAATAAKILTKAGKGTTGPLSEAELLAAKEILTQSQRGIAKLIPEAMQLWTGTSADTIRSAGKAAPKAIQEVFGQADNSLTNLGLAKKIEEQGVSGAGEAVTDDVFKKLSDVRNGLQKEIGTALSNSSEVINPQTYAEPFRQQIVKLETIGGLSKAESQRVAGLKAVVNDYFTVPVKNEAGEVVGQMPIEQMGADRLMDLKQSLKDLTQTFASTEGKSPGDREVMRLANQSYKQVSKDLDTVIANYQRENRGGTDLLKRYADYKTIERDLLPKFEDPQRAYNALRTTNNKSKRVFKEQLAGIDRKYETNISDAAEALDVWSHFGNPSFDAVSTGGSTSTSRTVGALAVGAPLGYGIGNMIAGPIGGFAGGAIGGFLASKSASPAAVSGVLTAQQAVARGAKSVGLDKAAGAFGQIPMRNAAPYSAWQALLNNRGE